MTEIVTGKQLRERAEELLTPRRPDKDSVRTWMRRGADRIDKLTKEVKRLENELEPAGSEAALMMLEDARSAADTTLDRIKEMEAEASGALDEARAEAEKEANEILRAAHSEAAGILGSARETAEELVSKTDQACSERLDQTIARADRVDSGCKRLVEEAKTLERNYRKRVTDIRTEAKAMVSLMERFDTLAVTGDDPGLEDDELLAEIVELKAQRAEIDDQQVLELDHLAETADDGADEVADEMEEAG